MDYGNMISDAFEYTREALIEKWMRWVLLTIVTIIPIVNFISMGYMMEIYRGTRPAPELENWGTLFVDGLKLFIVTLIYMIPVLVIIAIFGGLGVLGMIASGDAGGNSAMAAGAIASLMGGIFLALIVALLIGIIAAIGVIRFTRTGSISEAFNFSAILETIGRIGWVDYIIALVILFISIVVVEIVLTIITTIVTAILSFIPIIGVIVGSLLSMIISLIIVVPLYIFEARYLTEVYDST
ncbi:DUF4013 domain-containing protein [Methanosphaerula subterraneus]|uniref:DUF4013 domain-containing protein n=1 Tax=Methanosphaerula subterraneus TaxID=3350244 RepID=UPI003F84E423